MRMIRQFKEKGEGYFLALKELVGKDIEVIIDRPLGSVHPHHPDIVYSVNYGYIEGIIAPDGDYQDAYLLGYDEPIEKGMGKVIAIIEREDDDECKLVIARKGTFFSEEEILSQVAFQERLFQSHLIK